MKKITNEELCRPTAQEFASMSKLPITIVLDNIRSGNNVGSFFRTADAFGMEAVWLCGICATPPSRDLHKTALGAEQTVEWRYFNTTTEAIQLLKDKGYRVLCIEQVEDAIMLDEFKAEEDVRYALVFGNEVEGVSQEVVDICDGGIEVPQVGTKHSINVAVCGGVILWEMFRQISAK